MVYCGRSSRQEHRSQRSNDLQYVSAGSAKYDVHTGDIVTWKQQQQPVHLYNRQSSQMMMRQQPGMYLTERDYATTLQMRRSAGQPSTPLLRPLPAETFDPSAAASCSCPLHGHLATPPDDDLPPPPSPLPSATSPRFSSFRPRVEHIYEVPKFADGGGGGGGADLEDEDEGPANCSSTLYSELDTTAFGTVGRRTPSTRGSRRQPYSSLQC